MKRIFTLLLFCAAAYSCFSQTGTVHGKVMAAKDNSPVAGASIYLLTNKTQGTVTDANGNYQLTIPIGDEMLICSSLGYVADTFRMSVTSGDTSIQNISLQVEATQLENIVISAGKYQQNLEDVTISMEVLKPKLIQNRNTTNIIQALEQVPGLNILDEEPQIRGGSGFAFGIGSRVATLIDGIPVMRADIGKPDWNFIPIENLEQVEVIKGAASVLYGSSALSGVINFLTKYPTKPSETELQLYSGFYSAPKNSNAKWWTGAANYSGFQGSQSWKTTSSDIVIGGQLMYDHNYIGPPIITAGSPFTSDSISNSQIANRSARINFNYRYRPKNNTNLSMGVNGNFMRQKTNFSLIWGNDSDQIYRAFPGTTTFTDDIEYYIDPFFTYYSPSGFHHEIHSRIYVEQDASSDSERAHANNYYVEYQLSHDLPDLKDAHLSMGAILNYNFDQNTLYANRGNIENKQYNYAAYAQLDKKFWNVLNVSVGLRGEYFQTNTTDEVFKPIFRAGANLKLSQGTFLRFSYGQGFRYPTIAEKYVFTNVGGLLVLPNPDLKPENSWTSEIGVKQGLKLGTWYGFFDAAAFWQKYHNTIEYNYALWAPDTTGFKFVNTGDSRVKGLDLSLTGDGKIYNNLEVTIVAGYTYTLPQSLNPDYVFATEHPAEGYIPKQLSYASTSSDTTNNILKYRMPTIAKIDADLYYKPVSFGFGVRYYSYMRNIDKLFYDLDRPGLLPTGITQYRAVHNNGTWVCDARIGCDLGKFYKASIIVNNIFNTEYSLRPLKIESPRTIALQLRASL